MLCREQRAGNTSQRGEFTIGESASPDSPVERGQECFSLSLQEDSVKEGVESFTLSLRSDDACVWLGRDGAIVTVPANGG